MDYFIFSLSLMLIYVGLASLLHVQFGLLGIPNFGVVGFWGFGMYSVGVLNVQANVPFVFALIITAVLALIITYILGRVILQLEGQAILCATLAFSAIITLLVVTEKWLTFGVVGLGTINYPWKSGDFTEFTYFIFLVIVIAGIQHLIARIHKSSVGRVMIAIRDHEELASSLGKDTFTIKLQWFTATSVLMALLGGLSAPLNQFLTPNMLVPGLTFAVWISLVLGGKEHRFGAMIGVFVTFGLFDILIETYAPVAPKYAVMVPNIKLFLYGAMLVLALLYRPRGLLFSDEGKASRSVGPV